MIRCIYMDPSIELDSLRLTTARAIAIKAGVLLLEYRNSLPVLRQQSGEGSDYSKQADIGVDELVRMEIKKVFPNDEVLSEESAPASFAGYETHQAVWIIDPLDGTTNFSLGEDYYAFSIAFVRNGKPVLGAVYLPTSRELLIANAADGTIRKESLTMEGGLVVTQPHVSDISDPKRAAVGHNWAYSIPGKERMHDLLKKLFPGNFRAFMARGSVVRDLAAVAEGRLHAYVQDNLKPWDVAAAGLMVQLAGGMVTGLDGTPWHPFRTDIVASNGHLHPLLIRLLK
jgi:myo-inositol-1(or 4)-monophosphatase